MTYFQAIILGLVQGLTEFLPISSSGHLILVPWLLGWEVSSLAFDVALHWGTLLGVLVYFRRDIRDLFIGFAGSLRGGREVGNRMPWYLVLGTIPAGLIGLLFEDLAETVFRGPWVVATMLAAVAVLLFFADRKGRTGRSLDTMTAWHAFAIGAAQGIAIVPGTSRSGITISVALLLAFDRSAAVRFSFLLSIPIILAAGTLKIGYFLDRVADPVFLAGFASAAVAGYAAVSFLIRYVRTRTFTPFVVYRIALAIVIAGLLWKQA